MSPNNDTPDTSTWLDLSQGSFVIDVAGDRQPLLDARIPRRLDQALGLCGQATGR